MTGRLRLGEILVRANVITDEQLQQALEAQADHTGRRQRLGTVIAKLGLATEAEIATAIAEQLGVPFIDVATLTPDPEILRSVSKRLAEHHQVVAIERTPSGHVAVVMADPTNIVAIDDLRVKLGGDLRIGVSTQSAIHEAIQRWYGIGAESADAAFHLGEAATVEVVPQVRVEEDDESVRRSTEMAPIVRLVNAIVSDAVKSRATDIHIEPQSQDVKVRFRIDGMLREVMTLPKYVQMSVVSRIKVMSGMDITERRRPQDGRGRILVDGEEIDTRVSTVLTLQGEKVVVRLLRKGEDRADLTLLGMDEHELGLMERLLSMPQGLVIFTGPTGSGKTTSMYAAMRRLLDPSKNVVTLEDPIEYQVPGVNQVQIDERTGTTFARGLRTVLRQDPNVILVGEIRDGETAQIAMQAALTGHLVFSTLHTNDAPSAVTRLIDIGVEPFLIGSALSAVIAQRLLRRVCEHCTERSDPSERTLSFLGLTRADLVDKQVVQGAGCDACGFTGYRGRTGIFEIMLVTRHVREQIAAGTSETALAQTARADEMRTLRQAGLAQAFAGITTLEEVLRATYFERDETRRCPHCRQEVERSFQTCPYCRHSLAGLACDGCGRSLRSDWQACPWCGSSSGPGSTAPGQRVLLVDADADDVHLVEAALTPTYEVAIEPSPDDAVRRATLERPDAILLATGLPDGGGLAVLAGLREHIATRSIPVIMITAEGEQSAEVHALQAGADDFIRKPLEGDVLRARLAAILRRAVRTA